MPNLLKKSLLIILAYLLLSCPFCLIASDEISSQDKEWKNITHLKNENNDNKYIAPRIAYYIYEKIGISVILLYKEEQVKRFLGEYIKEKSSNFSIKDKCGIKFQHINDLPIILSMQDRPFTIVDYEFCAQQNIYNDQPENKKKNV